MKKCPFILLILLMLPLLTACGNSEQAETDDTNASPPPPASTGQPVKSENISADASENKILIAYFTWADNTIPPNSDAVDVDAETSASVLAPGNTAQMAEWIQAEMGGDFFSIVVTEPYSSDYDECLDRAADEKADNARPALTSHLENIDDYDVIFLGYPNWWYTAPMAVFSFIDDYNLAGKTVIPFCSHGTSGLANSVQDITAAMPDSTVLEPIGVYRQDVPQAQDDIKEWLAGLNL